MHRLSRIFSIRRRSVSRLLSIYNSPEESLPMELWELVFEALENESLLVAARVCCAWNDRCSRMFLLRSGLSQADLSTGNVNVDSYWLPALQFSRLPLRTLTCRSWGWVLMRDLRCLKSFISQSRDLEQLNITFCCNFTRIHVTHDLPCSVMRAEFCDVLRAMAQKTSGPIIMILNSEIYLVDRRDLAKWWPKQRDHPGIVVLQRLRLFKKARAALERRIRQPEFSLTVGKWGSGPTSVYPSSLYTVEIRTVHPESAARLLPPFTLLTFDDKTQHKLLIGCRHSSSESWVSAETLDAILPYIHLPALEIIQIGVVPNSRAFTTFLAAHGRIREIELKRDAPAHAARADAMLTDVPVTLPSLARISFTSAADVAPLLNSVHPPPNLTTIAIVFARATPSDALAFKRAMRRLSLHIGEERLCLELRTSGPSCVGQEWPDAEDKLITSVLYCVSKLYIEFSTEDDVRSLLPWAACLPRLQSLGMCCPTATLGETSILLHEVKAALPWVPDIWHG